MSVQLFAPGRGSPSSAVWAAGAFAAVIVGFAVY